MGALACQFYAPMRLEMCCLPTGRAVRSDPLPRSCGSFGAYWSCQGDGWVLRHLLAGRSTGLHVRYTTERLAVVVGVLKLLNDGRQSRVDQVRQRLDARLGDVGTEVGHRGSRVFEDGDVDVERSLNFPWRCRGLLDWSGLFHGGAHFFGGCRCVGASCLPRPGGRGCRRAGVKYVRLMGATSASGHRGG